jgi:hypothetical protein
MVQHMVYVRSGNPMLERGRREPDNDFHTPIFSQNRRRDKGRKRTSQQAKPPTHRLRHSRGSHAPPIGTGDVPNSASPHRLRVSRGSHAPPPARGAHTNYIRRGVLPWKARTAGL